MRQFLILLVSYYYLTFSSFTFRIYADVIHVKNSYIPLKTTDVGPKYGFDRNLSDVTSFLHDFYNEAKISPEEVEYVEGTGAGKLRDT